MEITDIKRLDHLGIVSGVIKELKLIELIDDRIGRDIREKVSVGESVAAMMLNGLGFTGKPLYLTPHFFKTKPMDLLLRDGALAEYFNADKLGSALDKIHCYGEETLFAELSASACAQEHVDTTFKSLDTTSISVNGAYNNEPDEHTISIKHGKSKDCRPDLKQLVHEAVVSQDGGIPLMMRSWNGNSSDNKIFQRRVKVLVDAIKDSTWTGYLIADCKLYDKTSAVDLNLLKFITRIPGTLKLENDCIERARQVTGDAWTLIDERNKYYTFSINHYGMEQRWIIVNSKSAEERGIKAIDKEINREMEQLLRLKKEVIKGEFSGEEAVRKYIQEFCSSLKYSVVTDISIAKKPKYENPGKPKANEKPIAFVYSCEFSTELNIDLQERNLFHKSCYIVGTNVPIEELSDLEVVKAYKSQNSSIENMGFRFLKDPEFFTASLFLKTEARIQALLMVMTLCLLVYSIAQRRLRQVLNEKGETIPNQLNVQTKSPTMRWVFQLFEGINVIYGMIEGKMQSVIQGINDVCRKIINYFGNTVQDIYNTA